MTVINTRRLATLTRQLITKCGGLDEASQACKDTARPYSVQQLSRCQTPESGCMLPIDIVACLEAHCGEPVVTRAICGQAQAVDAPPGDLQDDGCQAVEDVVAIVSTIRKSGPVSPRMQDILHRLIAAARGDLDQLDRDLDGAASTNSRRRSAG
jgi:hypothetical protein